MTESHAVGSPGANDGTALVKDRMTALEWRASGSLASIFALRMLGLFLILPVFAVHAKTMAGGDNATLVGLAIGAYAFTQAFLQLPFGAASDRFGRKPIIILGLTLFALGSFIAAAADTLTGIIIGRAIQGGGAISAAVTAFIADSTRDQHRTKAMALVGGSIAFTFALSLVAAPLLYGHIGMGGLFSLTGALALAAIGVVLWVVPPAPPKHTGPRVPFREVLGNRDLQRLNFGIFALHLIQMAMFVVIPVMLVQDAGMPVGDHWMIYLPVVLVSFVLMVPPIILAERKRRMRLVFLCTIAALAANMVGFVVLPQSAMWLSIGLLVFFVAFNIMEAALPSMVSRVAPPAAKGTALGVYNTTQAFGLFAGGLLGGFIARHFGGHAVFLAAAVLMGVWLLVAWRMSEPPQRKAAAASAATPAA